MCVCVRGRTSGDGRESHLPSPRPPARLRDFTALKRSRRSVFERVSCFERRSWVGCREHRRLLSPKQSALILVEGSLFQRSVESGVSRSLYSLEISDCSSLKLSKCRRTEAANEQISTPSKCTQMLEGKRPLDSESSLAKLSRMVLHWLIYILGLNISFNYL